ncbi:MAG: efflux RND transporter periplasmic adaptor subunit [Gammaproteobacteria bacterium]|nr:efflux RND transporter periplasmic adaptor subunit [Gammaproteobacteria bacterium]
MNRLTNFLVLVSALAVAAAGCNRVDGTRDSPGAAGHSDVAEVEPAKGPHRGRMLTDDDFAIELAIFETGVPPEFRVWATRAGAPISPQDVSLKVILTRLGGITDEIGFAAQDDFLRGDTVIYEPHSFVVNIEATYQGHTHRWAYDNFEGRTRIAGDVAEASGISVEDAGPATIREAVTVYGRVVSDPENVSHVNARFDGVIRAVRASIGDVVEKGQTLAVIEANDSLNNYTINAPISGTVIDRRANSGETTEGRSLFTIVDTSSVWAELAVFPSDRSRVRVGAPVAVRTAIGDISINGEIALLNPVAGANQSVTARVRLDNTEGLLAAGMYLTGEIEVAQYHVPLAVKRSGLQAFRDFTVVYALIGDEYEVRMLNLGRRDATWVEVLGGLEAGTTYVTTNSYLVKADIEKSGASHDH